KAMGDGFTFFVVYGRVGHLVDLARVQVVERDFPVLGAKEINTLIKQRLRRKLVVVGACIGTDAHTVGIDAILNVRGIAGEKGRASTSWQPPSWAWTGSSGAAPHLATWPATWCTRWSSEGRSRRERRADGDPSTVRAVLARALRRRARRRGVRAGPVR